MSPAILAPALEWKRTSVCADARSRRTRRHPQATSRHHWTDAACEIANRAIERPRNGVIVFTPGHGPALLSDAAPARGKPRDAARPAQAGRQTTAWSLRPSLLAMTAGAPRPRAGVPAPTRTRMPGGTRTPWALLMKHAFDGLDVLTCRSCGSRMEIVAVVQDVSEVRRYLAHARIAVRDGAPTRAWDPVPVDEVFVERGGARDPCVDEMPDDGWTA